MEKNSKDILLFQRLLKQVAHRFLENHTASSPIISEWKGQDIQDFQEDLRQKVQSGISEKWFYNYVKNTPEKLPRIDILNLLASYSGYNNWNAFKEKDIEVQGSTERHSIRKWVYAMFAILCLLAVTIYAFKKDTHTFHFCFVDADKKEPISEVAIDVIVLNEAESPTYLKTDSLGCITLETKRSYVKFVAQSPYHKNDTIYKSISKKESHKIHLKTDDYALMLHYYGSNNVKDWQQRRDELEKLIAKDAVIFELLPYQIGVELYSKKEFINKLTTPTESLRNLEIIETQYQNKQIVKLKFRIIQ